MPLTPDTYTLLALGPPGTRWRPRLPYHWSPPPAPGRPCLDQRDPPGTRSRCTPDRSDPSDTGLKRHIQYQDVCLSKKGHVYLKYAEQVQELESKLILWDKLFLFSLPISSHRIRCHKMVFNVEGPCNSTCLCS